MLTPRVQEPERSGSRGRKGVVGPYGPPPLTLLFGWAGSTDRNLLKYSDIYLKQVSIVYSFLLLHSYNSAQFASRHPRDICFFSYSNIVTYQHQPIWTASDKMVNTNQHDNRIIQNDAYQPKRSSLWAKMLNINQQGCTTAQMTLPTSHIFRVTEEVSGGRQSSFSMKILCYESSTPTSQELSSPFFQSLFICLSGIKNTWPNLHFLHYIKA